MKFTTRFPYSNEPKMNSVRCP